MSPAMGRRQLTKDLAELRRRLDATRASEVHFIDLTFTSLGILCVHLFSLSQVEWSPWPYVPQRMNISHKMTRQRLLLEGPFSWEWYFDE